MNELHHETSPYLLQHANNPVYWKAWKPQSLALAQESNKLIVVSIGYSACHWCHVMEHESFEDAEVGDLMNKNFINIKVDREERPDVDAVYMKAVQIMTGRGGWPMNVVCLPDGRPVWGGTYFRKEEWIHYLEQLQDLFEKNSEKVIDYAEKLHQGIQAISVVPNKNLQEDFDFSLIEKHLEKWEKSFDWKFGGYERAPKFMMPTNYAFLLRYGHQTRNQKLLEFVELTLTKMAHGGLFDAIDGGFSRYSVDMKWHVPHFEKMLYDNAQLVSLYADAYKLIKKPLYKEVIEKTLGFIEKELLNENGGFYSALDADSLNSENHLKEGAFYVWQRETLQDILKDEFDLFSIVYNINDYGHWEDGNYVLIRSKELEEIAFEQNVPLKTLVQKKKIWEEKLYAEREKRSKPRRDDKNLASWNALMLKGFADAYKVLQNEKYLKIALKNAQFILENLWEAEGNLLHSHKKNQKIDGFLEDYCFVIEAFIALYEVTFDEKWLNHSKELADYCLDHFYDEKNYFFSFTANNKESLIAKHYELEDNVIPSSNSVMAGNLFKLGIFYLNPHYEKIAQKMVGSIVETIDYPSAFSNWLYVFMNFSDENREMAICGLGAFDFAITQLQQYKPNTIIAACEEPSMLPFLQGKMLKGKTLLYKCTNRICSKPTEILRN